MKVNDLPVIQDVSTASESLHTLQGGTLDWLFGWFKKDYYCPPPKPYCPPPPVCKPEPCPPPPCPPPHKPKYC